MSNLVPTPRTDKNGRTVIRHMRPTEASSAVNLAAPHVAKVDAPHQEMTPAQIKNLIIDILMDGEEPSDWRSYNYNIIDGLDYIEDGVFLRRVFDLAVVADGLEDKDARRFNIVFLSSQLENEFKTSINIIYANLDMISPTLRWDHTAITIKDLRLKKRDGDRVPNLPAHLEVREVYPIPNNYSPQKSTAIYGRSEACRVVEDHPERIDDIMDLIQRGIHPDDLREALLTTDFGAASSLRKGAL